MVLLSLLPLGSGEAFAAAPLKQLVYAAENDRAVPDAKLLEVVVHNSRPVGRGSGSFSTFGATPAGKHREAPIPVDEYLVEWLSDTFAPYGYAVTTDDHDIHSAPILKVDVSECWLTVASFPTFKFQMSASLFPPNGAGDPLWSIAVGDELQHENMWKVMIPEVVNDVLHAEGERVEARIADFDEAYAASGKVKAAAVDGGNTVGQGDCPSTVVVLDDGSAVAGVVLMTEPNLILIRSCAGESVSVDPARVVSVTDLQADAPEPSLAPLTTAVPTDVEVVLEQPAPSSNSCLRIGCGVAGGILVAALILGIIAGGA